MTDNDLLLLMLGLIVGVVVVGLYMAFYVLYHTRRR